ncbi:MAG: hypothetical protein J6B63_04655 [Treponema sp.]|nr:hypothetical protein [Treponema sp.]MBP3630246.1 hypothetical protein [Clostridia bacterium]
MIKEALQYIVGMKEPFVKEIDGKTYTDKSLEVVEPPKHYARNFEVNTLSSFVEYIKKNKDNIDYKNVIIHISDYKTVVMFSTLDAYKNRESYIICRSNTPTFKFDNFYSNEEFNIKLQSLFCDTEDKKTILKLVGNIKSTDADTISDDGVTQIVQTKKGIVLGTEENVPNPVHLAPFRTFTEINQPISKFVFRISNGPSMALFEADGGAWRLIAVQRIKEYLEKELGENPDTKDIVILA